MSCQGPTGGKQQPHGRQGANARPSLHVGTAALFLAAAAVFAICAFLIQPRDYATSDFFSFWAAARLANVNPYNSTALEAQQQAVSPMVRSKRFIRPLFYAQLLRPLGRLSFPTAYAAWFTINVCAYFAFLRLWNPTPEAVVSTAGFVPLAWSFGLGQDAPLLLLIFAAGTILIAKGRDFAAGATLSLCSVKPNVFFGLPVALAVQRRYGALAGFLSGGLGLYLVSAAGASPAWPAVFVSAALENESTIAPNIVGPAGLLRWFGAMPWWSVLVAGIGAGWIYIWSKNAECIPAMAFAAAAGVIFAPRAMIYDVSFLLPLLLLRPAPLWTISLGVVATMVVTPLRPVVQILSPTVLWLARPLLRDTERSRPG